MPPRLRKPPRPPSARWIEDGPRSWVLHAGSLEAYAVQGEDDRWTWLALAGHSELRPSPRSRGTLSLVECQLAAEDWLRELGSAIALALG